MPSELGKKIQRLRKEKGLTLEQLADLTDSSKSYIWELENQKRHQHKIWPTHCVVGDDIEMETEKRGQAKTYRPCREYHIGHLEGDPLELHIYNSTRGHEIVHCIHDALLIWKETWKAKRDVTKNIEVIDIGMI